MKKYLAQTVTAIVLVLVLSVAAFAEARGIETFSYDDMKSLVAESKGKVVVINFFASWCPPCREEIPGLIRIRENYGKDKLVLIGASLDENDDALRRYMGKTRFNYPVKKSGRDLAQAAGVSGIPHLLIFDGKGEVVANQAGYVPEKDLREFLDRIMGGK